MYSHQNTLNTMAEIFGEAISTYSRRQAIEDGMLVDISEMAAEAGFNCPVAITRAAWSDCVKWTEADSNRQTHQDESGRLWDVLWMASLAAMWADGGSSLGLHSWKCTQAPAMTANWLSPSAYRARAS